MMELCYLTLMIRGDISLIQADNICNIYSKNYNMRNNKIVKNILNMKIEHAFIKAQKTDGNIKDKYLFLKISGTKSEVKIAMPLIKYFF